MFSISSREQILLLLILTAMVTGVVVKHWRDASREKPGSVPMIAAPARPQ